MNRDAFVEEIRRWLEDVEGEAVRLYDDGVNPLDTLKIATQVADSKANKRAMVRQALATGVPALPRRN